MNRVRVSEKIVEVDKKLVERFSIVLRTQRISRRGGYTSRY